MITNANLRQVQKGQVMVLIEIRASLSEIQVATDHSDRNVLPAVWQRCRTGGCSRVVGTRAVLTAGVHELPLAGV